MRKVAALLVLALPTLAQAELGLAVHGLLGWNGEAEADEGKLKKPIQSSFDPDDEDLEKNFGLAVTYEVPMTAAFRLGGRGAFMTGEGDDTEGDHRTFDLGLWARYLFPVGGSGALFLGGALGPTYLMSEAELNGVDVEFTGIGYHIVLGGGGQVAINADIAFIGGLYYSYQTAFTLDGEGEGNGTKYELEMEDGVIGRFLFTAGVLF